LQESNRPKTGVDRSKYVSQKEYEITDNYSAIVSDRQMNDVYACWLDFDIQYMPFDRSEVSEIKCVSLSHFEKMIESGNGEIAPVYGDDLKRVVSLVQEIIKSSPN
jgi:hypothetical protein